MPLNGKTHHHVLRIFAKKIKPDYQEIQRMLNTVNVQSENFYLQKSWDRLTSTNMLPEGEKMGEKMQIKSDTPKRHMKQCVNLCQLTIAV